jgi:hypothetical protein
MTIIAPEADLQAEFQAILDAVVRAHAGELSIRIAGDRAQVIATIRGEQVQIADWSASRLESVLPAAFALCDKADAYVYGSARSMRMTGERMALPETVSMILAQFFAPKDGGRVFVARITREGDTCCGSCGG